MKEYRWDVENRTKLGQYLTQVEWSFLAPFLKIHRIKNCLDLGCGSGRFTLPFYAQGVKMTCLDLDPLGLEQLAKKCPKAKIIRRDVSKKLPFADQTFDGLISFEFVDYMENLDAFFAECARVLAPKSSFVFTCGNKNSYKRYLYEILGKDKGRYLFSYDQIKALLEKNGFTLQKTRGFNWLPFRRDSNNPLIPIFAHLEKNLDLAKLPQFSPWVYYEARKK